MDDFIFYVELGLDHVLDLAAYDHILFLAAMTIPFTFKSWKKVLLLATVFTIAHCFSLVLSVYEIVRINGALIEFLIPVTIALTAIFNLVYLKSHAEDKGVLLHMIATAFFGLIHGFGFSNYFKMLMSEEEDKLSPLFGFATGIELSQVFIVSIVLLSAYLLQSVFKIKQRYFIMVLSVVVILITIPMLISAFP